MSQLAYSPDTLVHDGRSKKIYSIDNEHCLVQLIPTLDSYTSNRHRLVNGTAELRLDFWERAASILQGSGVPTAFVQRVAPTKYIAKLCTDPPFEVIVKNFAIGSTLRKYPGLFPKMFAFNPPVVKFDYRTSPEDQPIADDYLRAKGLDPDALKALALDANRTLRDWLSPLVLVDFCVVCGHDSQGRLTISSELSPDCMRIKAPSGDSYDKDLFREGRSDDQILKSWNLLLQLIGSKK